MTSFLGLSRLIDWMNERIGKFAAWAIVIAVLVSAANALSRKLFGISANWLLELQWYLFGAVFMLGAAWTFRDNEHIRIDIVTGRFKKRTRDWIDVFGHLFFLAPFVYVMISQSWPFFFRSYTSAEVSTNAGGLIIWPAKLLILVGFILIALQGVSELIKRLAIIQGTLEDKAGSGGHQAAAEAEAARLLAEVNKVEKA